MPEERRLVTILMYIGTTILLAGVFALNYFAK